MAEVERFAMDIGDTCTGFGCNDRTRGMIPDLLDIGSGPGHSQVDIRLPTGDKAVFALAVHGNGLTSTQRVDQLPSLGSIPMCFFHGTTESNPLV